VDSSLYNWPVPSSGLHLAPLCQCPKIKLSVLEKNLRKQLIHHVPGSDGDREAQGGIEAGLHLPVHSLQPLPTALFCRIL
jgi:hypothetical protein